MIRSFQHKGLRVFFTEDDGRLLDKKQLSKIRRILDLLEVIENIKELNIPGYSLHSLFW
jgi:proteic killer suppression protein